MKQIVDDMMVQVGRIDIQQEGCKTIIELAKASHSDTDQIEGLIAVGAHFAIVSAMLAHSKDVKVQRLGCQAVGWLAGQSDQHLCGELLLAGAHQSVMAAMSTHPHDVETHYNGRRALKWFTQRGSSEQCRLLLSAGVLMQMLKALQRHSGHPGAQALPIFWPCVFCLNAPSREDGDVCANDMSETSILQIQDSTNFASMLLHAKETCVKGTPGCWKSLSKCRTRMWQKVMAEKLQWMPKAVFNHNENAIGEVVWPQWRGICLVLSPTTARKLAKNTSISVNSSEFCSSFDLEIPNHLHFTFAREPFFFSLRWSIELTSANHGPWRVYQKMNLILGKHPRGSVKRAEALFSEFLKSNLW